VVGQRSVRLCNYTDVYKNDAITSDMDFMTATASDEQIQRFRIAEGDTLITKDSETADDIGVPAYVRSTTPDLICGYHLAIVRPEQSLVEPRFLYWCMTSQPMLHQWAVLASGVTRVGIRSSDLQKAAIAMPPINEQRALADFLDRETAQIDTLIDEQRRLIEMLAERRSAVVRHAMTPDSDWRGSRVKHLASTSLGKMLDSSRVIRQGDQLAPYVRAADVLADGTVNLNNLNMMPFSAEELAILDLRRDDILLIEGGATVGRPGYLAADAPGIAFQKTVNRLRVGPDLDPRFAFWSMLLRYESDYYSQYFGSVSFVHLTGEKLRELPLPHPPLARQQEIAAHLDEQTTKIDDLITATKRFIDFSNERRAALIAATVTGQVDVRDVA
jgi:type I restriction enzyme S subunit